MNTMNRIFRYLVIPATAVAACLAQDMPPRPQPVVEPIVLMRAVNPPYPSFARVHRLRGAVEMSALITKEGKVSNLKALSGDPGFVGPAMAAVTHWTYRPARINGVPVNAMTRIRVIFALR